MEPVFRKYGKAVFWDEPSVARGDADAKSSKELLEQIIASLAKAASTLPDRFVILTESFGSIMAELFHDRVVKGGKLRSGQILVGILHTPPVMDLEAALRLIQEIGRQDLTRLGKKEDAARLQALIASHAGMGTREFSDGVDLAFTSPELLPRYFSNAERFDQWAIGFADPRFRPSSEVRAKILRAFVELGLPAQTTFRPDVRTWVFAGAHDPYRPTFEFQKGVDAANALPRTEKVRFVLFEKSHHYPFIDEAAKWLLLFDEFMKSFG